jgi:hypothetical protein
MSIPIRLPGWLTAILLILFAVIFLSTGLPVVPPKCDIEQAPTRDVLNRTVPIESLWGVAGVQLENLEHSLPMVSTPELLIVARMACNEVTAFDLHKGKIAWRAEQDNPEQKRVTAINLPENLTLDYTRNRIYVSGFDEVRAIDVSDGNTIWRTTSDQFTRNPHYVVIKADGQLTVSASGEWFINPETGELSETPLPHESEITTYTPTIDDYARQIVVNHADYRVISNIVRNHNTIYILDADARLHLLDADNGEETGLIKFEHPIRTNLLYAPGAIGGSWIAAEGNTLATYFQDSDMVSVYRLN